MSGVITASEPSWIAPFTQLSPRQQADHRAAAGKSGPSAKARSWSLPLEDRFLLVAAYWRTNLTLRQLTTLCGISESAADRIIDRLGPSLTLQPRKRFRKGAVLNVDGTLVPTRDHTGPSSRRTTGSRPITRSSSTPTADWLSPSAGRWPATASRCQACRVDQSHDGWKVE